MCEVTFFFSSSSSFKTLKWKERRQKLWDSKNAASKCENERNYREATATKGEAAKAEGRPSGGERFRCFQQ